MSDLSRVEFRTTPERYRHWRLATEGPVATLTMDVDEQGGIVSGYELKLNSYDLGVDIELYDAVQRLRFEHPEVRTVVITSGKPKIFCAGANIRMLAASPHGWKVRAGAGLRAHHADRRPVLSGVAARTAAARRAAGDRRADPGLR
jgi:benzoyl-CoA-dihydrodiol lyase